MNIIEYIFIAVTMIQNNLLTPWPVILNMDALELIQFYSLWV